ncbi:MAG: VOC family protein [Bacteroidota bacterium]
MKTMNNIIFADLSTYTPTATIAFYEKVFGWKYREENAYYTAYKGSQEVVGLYETPEKFKQMRMPHFWMTYIQVGDVNAIVEKAKALGGMVEVVDQTNAIGPLALIRDPQGAGFTIYSGNLFNTRTDAEKNTLIWNELHVSNMEKIIPFYQGIFDWTFHEVEKDHYHIYTSDKTHIADALNIPTAYKGKYEYWVCTFGVGNLEEAKEAILRNGGSLIIEEGERILFADHSGQAFFYAQEV